MLVTKRPYGVEMTELQRILKVVRSTVLVLLFPSYTMRSPPTVQRTRRGLDLAGRFAATIFKYVGILLFGILCLKMKCIVSVPFISLGLKPCARRPISLNFFFRHSDDLVLSDSLGKFTSLSVSVCTALNSMLSGS